MLMRAPPYEQDEEGPRKAWSAQAATQATTQALLPVKKCRQLCPLSSCSIPWDMSYNSVVGLAVAQPGVPCLGQLRVPHL